MTTYQKLIQCIFSRSWWVIAFVLICTILYEQGLKDRDLLFQQLTKQLITLQHKKKDVLREQQKLQLQINSQSDLACVELTLMKGLGLVPEGQKKIYFFPDEYCQTKHSFNSEDELSLTLRPY